MQGKLSIAMHFNHIENISWGFPYMIISMISVNPLNPDDKIKFYEDDL